MTWPDQPALVPPDAPPVLLSEPPDDEWWRGAVIYQIYLRSFQDSNGDGIGDLPGVLRRLDYIASLGVDAVWLSPFYRSPQKDFGYDVSDFRAIQPEMGSFEDFRQLRQAVREKGLKLLIDFVPGHTSEEHPWFQESRSSRDNPKADWYVWADAAPDGTAPNNWISSFGGPAWTWDPRRSQFYFHPFLSCQPALDLTNPAVLEAVLNELGFWLRQGVDGVRLDAVQCITCDPDLRSNPRVSRKGSPILLGGGPANPFARQVHLFDRDVPEALDIFRALRRKVDETDGERVLLGELSDVDSPVVCEKYTSGRDGLNLTYDYDLINVPSTVKDWRRILVRERETIQAGWTMNVLGNHDATRALSNFGQWAVDLGRGEEMAKLLLVMLVTLRGGACLYQGQELGLTEADIPDDQIVDPWGLHLWPDFKGRDGCRTPMPWESEGRNAGFTAAARPWLPVPKAHRAAAVDRQERDETSPLSFCRRFLSWRRQMRPLLLGDIRFLDVEDPLLAYERFDQERNLLVALNFSTETRELVGRPNLQPVDPPGVTGRIIDEGVELPPLAAAIAEQRPPRR